jgi:hypothetical protein
MGCYSSLCIMMALAVDDPPSTSLHPRSWALPSNFRCTCSAHLFLTYATIRILFSSWETSFPRLQSFRATGGTRGIAATSIDRAIPAFDTVAIIPGTPSSNNSPSYHPHLIAPTMPTIALVDASPSSLVTLLVDQ